MVNGEPEHVTLTVPKTEALRIAGEFKFKARMFKLNAEDHKLGEAEKLVYGGLAQRYFAMAQQLEEQL